MAARVGSQLQPAFRFVNDLMREQKFLDAELLQIGLGGGDGGLKHVIQGILRGRSEPGFEGGDASGPVVPGGKPANGAEGTTGLFGRGAVGTPALEPEVGDEGREIGWSFIRLTLPETREHRTNDER